MTAQSYRRRPRPSQVLAAITASAALVALASCGSGDESSAAGGLKQAEKPAAPRVADDPATTPAKGSATDSAATTTKVQLIRTAQVSIEVSGELPGAVAQVKQVALQFKGRVESETTGLGDTAHNPIGAGSGAGSGSTVGSGAGSGSTVGSGESMIVLRVPEPTLNDALAAVSAVPGGKVLSQTSSTQDVTGDVADLTSRVASKRASLDRVRALMTRATSLQDVVSLESELARRQADLEALESRLKTLNSQADLATLTVRLRTRTASSASQEPKTGFLAGLKAGWHALQASTTATLTLLGALLPVAAVLALPGWLLLRHLRRGDRRRLARLQLPPAGRPHGSTPASPGPDQPSPTPAGKPSEDT